MTEQRDRDRSPTPSQPSKKPADSPQLEPAEASWTDRLTGVWQEATSHLTQRFPVDRVAQKVVGWFSVSDARVAEILAAVRAQLPATEALLIGKPQAGKSSIVRGLTGVSAEIIGQGFRPHTQHTQRYAYPSEDIPLLIFTDTVGLGDI
ncbi:MAG: GTPase, partial [Cyanobacteriota bacterium]|nr:GTPase [Cyanobacteriota bacterium]